MTPIFHGGAIAGFSDGNDRKMQLGEAGEAAARIHRNLVTATENEPAELGIDLRDQRALVSPIGGIERGDRRGIAAFPRRLPYLYASACRHETNLTQRIDQGKRQG